MAGTTRGRLRQALTGVAVCALMLGVLAGPASAKQSKDGPSNPGLSLSTSTLPANGRSTVQVTGTDYLVPDHVEGASVFGGVYVLFGWVQPGTTWGPGHRNSTSNNGTFGVTYAYPGDNGGVDTRDDGTGVIRLVSFTPGGESGSSTDFHMDAAGNWSVPLVINGSTFTYKNNVTGAQTNVDCQVVQCGVFTIGAHGKSSKTNEVFTPITFVGAPPPPSNTQPPTNNPGGIVGGGASGAGAPASATNPGGNTPTPPSGGAGTGATVPGATSVPGAEGTAADEGAVAAESTTTTVDAKAAADEAQRSLEATLAAADRASQTEVPVVPLIAIGLVVVLALAGGGFFMWRRSRAAA